MPRRLLTLLVLFAFVSPAFAKDDYKLGPDSEVNKDVPHGKIERFTWKSKVFADTERDVWYYVPAQYDGKTAACVMVFQDGAGYMNPKGSFRVPVVLDNLIAKKELPVTVAIFIDPGHFPGKPIVDKKGKKTFASNRSFEYDTLSPQYAEFLEKEILPEVGSKVKLRSDAAGRGIGGISSGGICAFTVAWERPDLFSKVLSHVGSFTNIRGGDRYPGMIRKTKNKPIRVFLQDGEGDLDNEHGNWPLGNKQMEAALKYKKYDYKMVWGDGGHNGKQGGAILPDSLRWLWRDTPASAKADTGRRGGDAE
ncbi:MAG: alpha/beta hydrolase-fold protein [Gemmataceae bacterium]